MAVQLMRLRRAEFLPGWPGFAVDHLVQPGTGIARSAPLNLIVLGDSTTVGVGVDRPEDALPIAWRAGSPTSSGDPCAS